MMGRGNMLKELTGGRRKRSQMRKMERAGDMMESPRKKMASGIVGTGPSPQAAKADYESKMMKAPKAMSEMPMGMKKGGMAKRPASKKMAKGGLMVVIGLGKPKMKKGK